MDLIEKVKPHEIYAAGDLADPTRNTQSMSGRYF